MGPSPQLLFPPSTFPPASSSLPRAAFGEVSAFGGFFEALTGSAGDIAARSWGYASVADAKRQLTRSEWSLRYQVANTAASYGVPGAAAWLQELAIERANMAAQHAIELGGEAEDKRAAGRQKMLVLAGVVALGAYAYSRRTKRNPAGRQRTLTDRAGGGVAFAVGTTLTLGSLLGILFPEPLSSAAGLATIGIGLALMSSGYEAMTGGSLDVAGVTKKNPSKRRRRRSRRRR